MELSGATVLIGFLALMVGPGSGVWIALKAGQSTQQLDSERFYSKLSQIEEHLRILNHRVTKSEGDITGLERREGR
jgi:hypothetical protein